MSFKKPFKAVPVKLGQHYRAKRRRQDRKIAFRLFVMAIGAGIVLGIASVHLV
jgi:hypothetical protein